MIFALVWRLIASCPKHSNHASGMLWLDFDKQILSINFEGGEVPG